MDPMHKGLRKAIDNALHAMQAHPQHHLYPYYRQQIYVVFKLWNSQRDIPKPRSPRKENPGDLVRAWLGIITAEKVLPIFEQFTFRVEDIADEDDLPHELLRIATSVMQDNPNIDEASGWAINAHLTYCLWLEDSKYDPVHNPTNVVLAGCAAQRALSELLGWDYFDLLHTEEYDYWLGSPTSLSAKLRYLGNKEPTDDKLVWRSSDSAANAAVASACGYASTTCDPEKLLSFWLWWLTEAIPQAMDQATKEIAG